MDAVTRQRLKDLAAMALIGDGVVGFLTPQQHCRLWEFGPKPCRDLVETFARRPNLTQLLAATEVGLGAWLAMNRAPD